MSTSRRKFIKAGVLAATFAALPARNILGQSFKQRDGDPTEVPVVQTTPLPNYSKATFVSYLNSVFELHTVNGIVGVTLLSVDDMPAPKGGECFTLLFRGGGAATKQDTYTLVHPALGTFQLMLVPAGSDQNGAQGYLATINRISQADFARMSPPSRSSSRAQPPASTPASSLPSTSTPTAPTTVTNAPSPTVVTTPVANPGTSPTPPPRRKKRPRKAAQKRVDDRNRLLM